MKNRVLFVLLIAVLLAGCAGASAAEPTPLPTVVLGDGATAQPDAALNLSSTGGGVRAAGIVVPLQEAQLAASTGGTVQSVQVELGEQVEAGQVLMTLAGGEALTAAVQAANLELLSAQQALTALKNNAEQDRSAALLRLANAQKALEDAQNQRASRSYRNGSQSTIEAAQADLVLAEKALETAQDTFNGFSDSAENDINRAAALSALSSARKAYDRALANLNYLLAMPNQVEIDQAQAELQSAQAEVELAQQEVDRRRDGPDTDALALAEARLNSAQAQVNASQAALDALEIKAPFSGTVSKIDIRAGEWVQPGQPVVVLADLSRLRVETTDLSERDVPGVKTGQTASVFIKALGLNINGTVADVSPLADTLGGDVVYQTVIDLDSRPEDLRAGMSADVVFNID